MVHINTVCTWLRTFVASSALSRLRASWGGTLGQNLVVGGTQTFLRTRGKLFHYSKHKTCPCPSCLPQCSTILPLSLPQYDCLVALIQLLHHGCAPSPTRAWPVVVQQHSYGYYLTQPCLMMKNFWDSGKIKCNVPVCIEENCRVLRQFRPSSTFQGCLKSMENPSYSSSHSPVNLVHFKKVELKQKVEPLWASNLILLHLFFLFFLRKLF